MNDKRTRTLDWARLINQQNPLRDSTDVLGLKLRVTNFLLKRLAGRRTVMLNVDLSVLDRLGPGGEPVIIGNCDECLIVDNCFNVHGLDGKAYLIQNCVRHSKTSAAMKEPIP